jgi:hypothetical protein
MALSENIEVTMGVAAQCCFRTVGALVTFFA